MPLLYIEVIYRGISRRFGKKEGRRRKKRGASVTVHQEVRFTVPIVFMYHMSILGVSGAQDGDQGQVSVCGAGAVGHRGPGSSP